MSKQHTILKFLPTSREEMERLGWEQADVILFSGDAYVDHPSFGVAIVARVLESCGLLVAVVPQPNWRDDLRDFKKMGKPRLFFGVASGNMDSMVNHYTANKRLRSDDNYTPGGQAGYRPDYATTVYSKIIKELYPDVPLVIGGIEASLRRLTHFDYWSEKLMPPILVSTGADLLIYGMAEKALKDLVKRLKSGQKIGEIYDIPQTVYFTPNVPEDGYRLGSFEESVKDKKVFAKNFRVIEEESNAWRSKVLYEPVKDGVLIVNPPYPPISEQEMDEVYALPYNRIPHPRYQFRGPIPAFEMIKNSIVMHRGCFGGCSFCTISAHQGKHISSRSEKSILNEVKQMSTNPDFKGHISDLGGPSANMYKMKGKDLEICSKCKRPSCIFPGICFNLNTDHSNLTQLYQKAREVQGVKQITIGSGIRYDLMFDKDMQLKEKKYVEDLFRYHVSGRLKVAPEHSNDEVLKMMRKPSFKLFHKFKSHFDSLNTKYNRQQQLIPYFISSHPGSEEKHMAELAVETKSLNYKLEQVQDFTPTPMTLSSVVYYTGIDPYTMRPVYVAKKAEEKMNQQQYFFWYKKELQPKITNQLRKIGKPDWITALFGSSKPQNQRFFGSKPKPKNR